MNTFLRSFFSAGLPAVFANILSGCGKASQLSISCFPASAFTSGLGLFGSTLNSFLTTGVNGDSGLGLWINRVFWADVICGNDGAICNELLCSPMLRAIYEPPKSGKNGLNLLKLFLTCWIPIELKVDWVLSPRFSSMLLNQFGLICGLFYSGSTSGREAGCVCLRSMFVKEYCFCGASRSGSSFENEKPPLEFCPGFEFWLKCPVLALDVTRWFNVPPT